MCGNHEHPDPYNTDRRDPFSLFIFGFIKVYRLTLSPIIGRQCRFQPTCSEYMVLATRKYGPVKGFLKGCYRVLRCNPFNKGGMDWP